MKIISLSCLLLLLVYAQCETQYKITTKEFGTTYFKFGLKYTGNEDYYIKEKSKIIKDLELKLQCHTFSDFRFKIYDPNNKRFEVPQYVPFPFGYDDVHTFPILLADFTYSYTQNPFSLTIHRKTDGSLLFSSVGVDFIFSDYYLQIGTKTSSNLVYGFSERFTDNFRLKPGKWTLFPRDRGQSVDKGIGNQTHGYYPIYLERQKGKRFHLNYFRSSNALDVIVEDGNQENYVITYKTIGGIIDFRFFLGEFDPQYLVTRFHKRYLEKSAIPPFWSLGFHQSRWGYKNVDALERVIQNFEKNGIPFDAIWSDIDYMKDNETFTIDEERFPLDRMAKILQDYHYVPIIEPSIKNGSGFAYEQGKKENIFIKDAEGNDQIGRAWAGDVVFTDFLHPHSYSYWNQLMLHLYQKVKFSGIWFDMNEPSSFCNGPCYTPSKTGMDYTNDIPYHPGSDGIETQTIPLNATHYGGGIEANFHVFFGFLQSYTTYIFWEGREYPFIITRSSTLGSNKYAFHWTGDNYANFEFLKLSIASNFMFNMWGIQMVGSDICGFGGNATEEICARWFQVGSLYPFARDHNEIQDIDQEPYALGPRVLKSSKVNLKLRYSILKTYYRMFINRRGSGTIYKPLFFVFHNDDHLYVDEVANTQMMIGNFFMSAPIVEEKTTKRSVYFPFASNWYDFHTGKFYQGGSTVEIYNDIDDLVPLFLREGHITFKQNVENVTKSSQLGSEFIFVGAFLFDEKNSTQTKEIYLAEGGLLSINDYNASYNVTQNCIYSVCDYEMVGTFTVDKKANTKTLILDVVYLGPKAAMEKMLLTDFIVYTKNGVYQEKTAKPIAIERASVKIIQFGTDVLIS